MARFKPVEIVFWKAEDLPSTDLALFQTTPTLYCELNCSPNEPTCTRAVECRSATDMLIKDRLEFNYDPESTKDRIVLLIKRQEVLSHEGMAKVRMSLRI